MVYVIVVLAQSLFASSSQSEILLQKLLFSLKVSIFLRDEVILSSGVLSFESAEETQVLMLTLVHMHYVSSSCTIQNPCPCACLAPI